MEKYLFNKTVNEFMGKHHVVKLFDYCEYMAKAYSTTMETVTREARNFLSTSSDFMISDDCWSEEDYIIRTR